MRTDYRATPRRIGDFMTRTAPRSSFTPGLHHFDDATPLPRQPPDAPTTPRLGF